MSFSTKKTPPVTNNVPILPEQLSTNQQTVPVPLWWGRRKIAVRWISPVTNQLAVQSQSATKK